MNISITLNTDTKGHFPCNLVTDEGTEGKNRLFTVTGSVLCWQAAMGRGRPRTCFPNQQLEQKGLEECTWQEAAEKHEHVAEEVHSTGGSRT